MTTDLHAKRRGTVNGQEALLAFPTYVWTEEGESPSPPEVAYALIPGGHVLVQTLTDVVGTMDGEGKHHDLVWTRLPEDAAVTLSVSVP